MSTIRKYINEEEEVNELLFHDPEVIEKISENPRRIPSLCRLLAHRSDNTLLNQSDIETILAEGPSPQEKYGQLLELEKRKDHHPSLQLLDCLRCTQAPASVPSLPSIHRTIIWVTPTSQYAALVVHTIQTMTLLSKFVQPHFWPVQHNSAEHLTTPLGYLYRVCHIFTSIHTKLVLVWPDSYQWNNDDDIDSCSNGSSGGDDLARAVEGSLSNWSSANLLVYTDILTAAGVNGGVSLYRTGESGDDDHRREEMIGELRKKEEQRTDTWSQCSSMNREASLYHQMMWLGRLAIEIERDNMESGESSELLQKLGWDPKEAQLTPYQSNILSQNLPDWERGRLTEYLIDTRFWSKDEGTQLGVVPGPRIRKTLQCIPSRFFSQIPQSPERSFFSIEERNDRIPEVIRNVPLPKLVTCGVVPAHLTTPTFYRLAVETCCSFTVECMILY